MQTVKDARSLVTTRNDIVAGFRWQADEKARRSNEFHAVTLHFRASIDHIENVEDIIADPWLRQFALGACALSAKGARQLGGEICRQIIEAAIELHRLSDDAYVTELERRYLLTCGDALGGSMRNAIGQRAQNKLSDYVCQYLAEGQIKRGLNGIRAGRLPRLGGVIAQLFSIGNPNSSKKTSTLFCWMQINLPHPSSKLQADFWHVANSREA